MLQTVVGEDRKVRATTVCMYDGSAISSILNCFGHCKLDSHLWT